MPESRFDCEFRTLDSPPPLPVRRPCGRPRIGNVREVLGKMAVGDCVDINRKPTSVNSIASRMRREYDIPLRVVVRELKPGWSRVWRTE